MFGLPVANEAFVSLTIISGIISAVALGLVRISLTVSNLKKNSN